jgi:hypothetical protein
MNALEARIRTAAKRHKPRGWKVRERLPRHGCAGQAVAAGIIYCPPLNNPDALYVYLHEVGHVVGKHIYPGVTTEADKELGWLEEFEAEKYAIGAMRAEGFRVDRETLADARRYVAEAFAIAHDLSDLDHPHFQKALRFAFPSTWRKHL